MNHSRRSLSSSLSLVLMFCVAVVVGIAGILRWIELNIGSPSEVQARTMVAARPLFWYDRAGVVGNYSLFPILPGNVPTWEDRPISHRGVISTQKNVVKGVITSAEPYAAIKAEQNVERMGLVPSGRYTIEVKFKNVGTATWKKSGHSALQLQIEGTSSRLRDPFWRSTTVVALLREDRVAPGETGSFRFAVSAPKTSGQILQTFQLKTVQGKIVSGSKMSVTVNVGLFLLFSSADCSTVMMW